MATVQHHDWRGTGAQETHSFVLLISGLDEITDAVENAIYERCPDATLATRAGNDYVAFDREAESLVAAILSAIHDVTDLGYEVIKVIPPDEDVIATINQLLRFKHALSRDPASEVNQLLKQLLNVVASEQFPALKAALQGRTQVDEE